MFNNNSSLVTYHTWDGYLSETSHIIAIANIVYTAYSIWLILTFIIILLAMIENL